MSFDMASFALGAIAMVVAIILYAGIVEALERRRQWTEVMFNSSSPSRDYWGRVLDQTPTEIEEATLERVIPRTPDQSEQD